MHGLCRQEFGDTCCRSVVTNVSTMFVRHLGGSFEHQSIAKRSRLGRRSEGPVHGIQCGSSASWGTQEPGTSLQACKISLYRGRI